VKGKIGLLSFMG